MYLEGMKDQTQQIQDRNMERKSLQGQKHPKN